MWLKVFHGFVAALSQAAIPIRSLGGQSAAFCRTGIGEPLLAPHLSRERQGEYVDGTTAVSYVSRSVTKVVDQP